MACHLDFHEDALFCLHGTCYKADGICEHWSRAWSCDFFKFREVVLLKEQDCADIEFNIVQKSLTF